MTILEIETLLKKNGVREAKAETYPGTYSIVDSSSFLASQVSNRDSASWKKAEFIILKDANLTQEVLEGWRALTLRDPQRTSIQKLCVPSHGNFYDIYNARGEKKENSPLDVIFPQMRTNFPKQLIYYGVPGCGKSHCIKDKLAGVPDFNMTRVVFHPDYSNADFIGQILPKVDNSGTKYVFTPGPLTRILRRAYLNPSQDFYLIIEEINRGQAAAILGETFQLCDRIKPSDSPDEFGYGPGWSSYGIENDEINGYIRDMSKFSCESHETGILATEFSAEDNRGYVTSYKAIDINWPGFKSENKLHFTENTAIRFPPNLSIFATMNTSDQNVTTLDNAFQRRFDMELIPNEFAKDCSPNGDFEGFKTRAIQEQYKARIAGTSTTWGDFWEKINEKITRTLKGLASTEDKRLGVWFVSNVDGEIPEKIFAEKVLKYLWDDVFKFKRPQIFVEECDTLEKLISKFYTDKFGVFKNWV